MQDIMLWNAILTLAVGAFLWWIRGTNNDINKLLARFDKLEEKLDRWMEKQ